MSEPEETKPSVAKILIAANRHLIDSTGAVGTALYFEIAEGESSNAPAIVKAHAEAVWAIKQLGIALERLGVASVCGKCNGSARSIGMTHNQPCDHCKDGLIYHDEASS